MVCLPIALLLQLLVIVSLSSQVGEIIHLPGKTLHSICFGSSELVVMLLMVHSMLWILLASANSLVIFVTELLQFQVLMAMVMPLQTRGMLIAHTFSMVLRPADII